MPEWKKIKEAIRKPTRPKQADVDRSLYAATHLDDKLYFVLGGHDGPGVTALVVRGDMARVFGEMGRAAHWTAWK